MDIYIYVCIIQLCQRYSKGEGPFATLRVTSYSVSANERIRNLLRQLF